MILNLATKIFGSSNDRALKPFYRKVEEINAIEPDYEKLSDEELRARTDEFRKRLADGETLDDILVEAFATVREASKRTLGMRHFDVQLIGGMVLHRGMIAEMKTGEGKTLMSTLPAYLNALEGKGAHVVTVNDYLAGRDAEWMGAIYHFLGMSVDCILHEMDDEQRRAAYQSDITYGTNNEFGFDYLRDNMKFRMENMVQRPHNFAIVDEVDSILIDEARTPLIISGPAQDSSELYVAIDKLIPNLDEGDFEKDEKARAVSLTDAGIEHMEEMLREVGLMSEGTLYDMENISLVHHANQALRAHKLFTLDVDYVIKDDKVVIIDEFTGRMMEGRRYSEGLHGALEAKEGVTIQKENQTLASITFQNYFRLYKKLSGMTGTALTEATEFGEIYGLDVVEIPTNMPMIRIDHNDKIFRTLDEKHASVVQLIRDCVDRKQPVLVGTTSIEKSEELSRLLKKNKIKHEVLNAKQHEREAHIVAQAGRAGAVTIATNMAGRGTDIKLGGNLEMRIADEVRDDLSDKEREKRIAKIKAEIEKESQLVKDAGGLYVISTERHESRRIDNQLRGRSGRQGDPGASQFFLSLQDDLMRIFGTDRMDPMLRRMGLKDGEAIVHPWISKAIERAQQKVEAQHFEIRKNLLRFDNVMNDQRKVIYEERREIMATEDVSETVRNMRDEVIEDMIRRCIPPRAYAEHWDIETLKVECHRLLGLELPLDVWAAEEGIADTEIHDRIQKASDEKMAAKAASIGQEAMRRVEKSVVLQLLDQLWKEHLHGLDHLRQGISLRAYAQKDPLNEYKGEAFAMFEMTLNRLREAVTMTLALVEVRSNTPPPAIGPKEPQEMHESRQDPAFSQGQSNSASASASSHPGTIVHDFDKNDPATWEKTPRNAPCPCGSGKKYKHCHGAVS